MTDWCKLGASYYRDPALIAAGEAAEVLFLRGLAFCAEQGTGGRIPRSALPFLITTKAQARADALVREHLWLVDGDDYLVRSWEHWQAGLDALESRRRNDRERQQRHRSVAKVSRDTSRDRSRDVTPPEKETEVEDELRSSVAVLPVQRRDELWEAVMAACDIDVSAITSSARSGYNKAVQDIRRTGATPDEVRRRAANYRQLLPNAALTPHALAKHWPQCHTPPVSAVSRNDGVHRRYLESIESPRVAGHLALIEQLGAAEVER